MISKIRVQQLIEFVQFEKNLFVDTCTSSFEEHGDEEDDYAREAVENFNDPLKVLNAVLNEMGGV